MISPPPEGEKRVMFDLKVIQRNADDTSIDLGTWRFAVVPQLMDSIILPGQGTGQNSYEIIRIEHHPIMRDSTRPLSAKKMPSVLIEVRFSHEEDSL